MKRQDVPTEGEVLTLSETARYLKLAERTIHRMIQRNEIPSARIGGQRRFLRSVLDDWLLSQMEVLPRVELAPFLDTTDGIVQLERMVDWDHLVDPLLPGTEGQILLQLVAPLVELGVVSDPQRYVDLLLARERLSSTVIGNGVAVPHIRRPEDNPRGAPPVLLGICRDGVPYGGHDGHPVHFFFLVATASEVIHLRVLKRISQLFRDRSTHEALLTTSSPTELKREFCAREKQISGREVP